MCLLKVNAKESRVASLCGAVRHTAHDIAHRTKRLFRCQLELTIESHLIPRLTKLIHMGAQR